MDNNTTPPPNTNSGAPQHLPQELPTKRITLDLSVFLSILWGSRDVAHPDSDIAELVAAIDSEEQYAHVQFPSEENKITIPAVWRIKTWKISEERRLLEKAKSDERVALWDMKKQLIDEVSAGIEKQLAMPEEKATDMARVLIEKGSVPLCKFYGVDITEYLRRVALLEGK